MERGNFRNLMWRDAVQTFSAAGVRTVWSLGSLGNGSQLNDGTFGLLFRQNDAVTAHRKANMSSEAENLTGCMMLVCFSCMGLKKAYICMATFREFGELLSAPGTDLF